MKKEEVLEEQENSNIIDLLNQKNSWAIVGLACAIGGVNLIGLLASLLGIKNAKKYKGEYLSFAIAGAIICIIQIFRIIIISFHSYISPVFQGLTTIQYAFWDFIVSIITSL